METSRIEGTLVSLQQCSEAFGMQHLGSAEQLSLLPQILRMQSNLFTSLNSQINSKVDRIEFSQIVSNKANNYEFVRLVNEMIKAKNFEHFQRSEKVNNLLSESLSVTHDDVVSERTKSEANMTPDRVIDYHLNNIIDINDQLILSGRGNVSSQQNFKGLNLNHSIQPSQQQLASY